MELKEYIKQCGKSIILSIEHIQLVEYKNKELDFVYGMEEYHTNIKRMLNQINRILWR